MAKSSNRYKKPIDSGKKKDIHEFLRQIVAGKKVSKAEFDAWEKEYKKWTEEQARLAQEHLERSRILLEETKRRCQEIEEMMKNSKRKKLVKKAKPHLAVRCDTGSFMIGNPVIAIADHSEGTFKTGDVFLLRGLKMGCHCTPLLLDIGLGGFYTACDNCAVDTFGGPWMGSYRFEPFDTNSGYTIERLLDELTK